MEVLNGRIRAMEEQWKPGTRTPIINIETLVVPMTLAHPSCSTPHDLKLLCHHMALTYYQDLWLVEVLASLLTLMSDFHGGGLGQEQVPMTKIMRSHEKAYTNFWYLTCNRSIDFLMCIQDKLVSNTTGIVWLLSLHEKLVIDMFSKKRS